jgi:hypothetical protein
MERTPNPKVFAQKTPSNLSDSGPVSIAPLGATHPPPQPVPLLRLFAANKSTPLFPSAISRPTSPRAGNSSPPHFKNFAHWRN